MRLGENLLKRLLIPHSRAHSVGGNVLIAVARPDIHNAGHARLLGKILRNADTRLAVVNPKTAHLLVGA